MNELTRKRLLQIDTLGKSPCPDDTFEDGEGMYLWNKLEKPHHDYVLVDADDAWLDGRGLGLASFIVTLCGPVLFDLNMNGGVHDIISIGNTCGSPLTCENVREFIGHIRSHENFTHVHRFHYLERLTLFKRSHLHYKIHWV